MADARDCRIWLRHIRAKASTNERERLADIGDHFVKWLGPLVLARPKENAQADACCRTRFHVAHLIADDGAVRGIKPEVRHSLQEHSGVRLAPGVIATIGTNAVEWVIGTVIDPAYGRALLLKSVAHPSRQLRIGVFVEVAAADTRLVRDDNNWPSHLIGPEAAEFENSGNELELIGPMDVAPINIYDAIPVEEERALWRGLFPEHRTSDVFTDL
jgi:hypothetical protein